MNSDWLISAHFDDDQSFLDAAYEESKITALTAADRFPLSFDTLESLTADPAPRRERDHPDHLVPLLTEALIVEVVRRARQRMAGGKDGGW